jgi:hypothetical protein
MKILPTVLFSQLEGRGARRNLKALGQFLLALTALVLVYSVLFHFLMAWEGQRFSWLTGIYWTLTVMSTLGFGDITFQSDAGRLFSIVVLLSGTLFMLVLLPFTFIQFFYAPWMEAQAAAMAPRELRPGVTGHVVLLDYGPIEMALIRQLQHRRHPYVVLAPDVAEALRLHDLGVEVTRARTWSTPTSCLRRAPSPPTRSLWPPPSTPSRSISWSSPAAIGCCSLRK